MRHLITSIFLLLLSSSLFAQSSDIEILQKKKQELQVKIDILQDSLYKVSKQIENYKSETDEQQPVETSARKGARLLDIPHAQGKLIMNVKEWTTLKVISYEDYYYRVCIEDTCGYVYEGYVALNGNVLSFKDNFFKQKKEREAKQKEGELAQRRLKWDEEEKQQNRIAAERNREKERSMVEKYGQDKVDMMKEGRVWIGMNEEQALYSRGKPKDINRTVGSWGVKEQWVYNGVYLYFENGELTSWQD